MNIEKYLIKSINCLKNRDVKGLRKIAADATDDAAVEQHRETILISLIDYSLSKILSKLHYDMPESLVNGIMENMQKTIDSPDEEKLKYLELIEKDIIGFDAQHGNYENNIMDKARIKKAAKLYEKGLSLRQAADIAGASSSEVQDFVGKSKIYESIKPGDLKSRLDAARGILQ